MEKELLEKLIAKALKLLCRRPQSEVEIKTKLARFLVRKKTKDKELYLAEVLKYLKKLKVLNDADFARWFISQRAQFRPRSKRRLYFELKQKGVLPEEIIKETLEDYNEEAACQKLAQKKSFLSKKDLISFFLRQGFPLEVVRTVLEN